MDEKITLKEYPYNLLIAARGKKMMEMPSALTNDVQAGIEYVLNLLDESEQKVLEQGKRVMHKDIMRSIWQV